MEIGELMGGGWGDALRRPLSVQCTGDTRVILVLYPDDTMAGIW
jgi:hypothetical protein